MKSARLLSILLLLQARGKMTGRALAERLAVSERTLHRDMEALSAARVPVFALRGSRGGWQLDEGWRTRVPGLDEAELGALLMAQPRVLGNARLAASAERALAKLMASLPASLRERARSLQDRLFVDPTGWRGTIEKLSALSTVQEAVARDRTLLIRYRQERRDAVERTVEPLGLVAKGTTWYLVANTSNGRRTYRVSRIEHAFMLDSSFTRPARFDLAAYWKAATTRFQEQRRYEATLRVDPDAAEGLRTWCRVVSSDTSDPAGPDGWATLRVRFDDEAEACFIVLGLGPRADVLDPATLKARVSAEVRATYARLPR